jgi:RHS repeat-associated protein
MSSGSYSYGFNGKENDNDVKGTGNSIDMGARIYDPRIGRFFNLDFFGSLKPGMSGFNFASNNPLSRIDPDGNYDVDPNASKREKRALTAMGDSYSKHLKGLQEGGKELNALLNRSGYKSKEDLIAAWDKKGTGSIMLRFSAHNENDVLPDRGHERTGGPGKDPYYLHPDGSGLIDGAYATGSGATGGGGTITFARTILNFQEGLNSKAWITPAISENGENTSFDYAAMAAGGYSFLNRIIGHEVTHVGADVNGLPTSVLGINGTLPAWVNSDASFSLFGMPFTLYHRGDVFEYEAFLKPVTSSDAQYGFAVNVYFRALGKMNCTVRKNPIITDVQREAINQAIWNYIKSDQQNLRSFKPDNKSNRGSWTIPVTRDH